MATPDMTATGITQATAQTSLKGVPLWGWITRIFKGLGFARGHAARERQISDLMRLSDAELADLGLSRDQIVAYVYRDRLG